MIAKKMIGLMTIRLTVLLALLCVCASVRAKEIRVGITEYQNVEGAYKKYQTFFQELEQAAKSERSANGSVTFSFAIGTYAEVIDWYNKKLIDVAILSAMPVADMLTTSSPEEIENIKAAYLGGLSPVGVRAATCTSKDACQRTLDEKSPQCVNSGSQLSGSRSDYRVSMVVPFNSPLKTFEDVKRMAEQERDKLRFLFVRPVSISGYIVPTYFLKQHGIELRPDEYDFTYQHQDTLQRMRDQQERDKDKYLVGFVIDNTSYCVPKSDSNRQFFTRLEVPDLSNIKIPHETILANYNLKGVNKDRGKDEYQIILDIMRPLLRTKQEGKTFNVHNQDSAHNQDWLSAYDMAKKIYEQVKVPRSLQYGSSFLELIKSLKTYKDSTGNEPRLALVLSGGGAKCSYQAGAVAEIENRLRELKQKDPKLQNIDFNLVVGTSGGAINALLTALGGTKNPQTQDYIRRMWGSFRQQEFFTPSPVFNLIFGLCFGLLQALAITFAVLLFGRKHIYWKYIGQLVIGIELAEISLAAYLNALSPRFAVFVIGQVIFIFIIAALIRLSRKAAIYFLGTRPGYFWARLYKDKVGDWWRLAGWLMLFISLAELIIARWPWAAYWPAGVEKDHAAHHLWMIVTLISSVSYPWPLLLGLLMVLSGIAGRFEIDWHSRRLWLVRGLTVLVVLLAGVLVLDSLWKQPSLSNASEIENAFIKKIPEMLAVLRPGFAAAAGDTAKEKLSDISRRIAADPSMMQRDLVITVSNLPLAESVEEQADPTKLSARQLPEDLYFYYKGLDASGGLPPNEKRFIDLRRDNPDRLLDVVIGSGTIYPLFPYRELTNINVRGKMVDKLKVIDGGFIHNSPIEAAIKWGATHIILIEASPLPKPFEPETTLDNSLVAFKYIMAQTQRMDAVARGEVEIFELRPRSECDKKNLDSGCRDDPEPNMDTFDFTPAITKMAFDIGREDAASLRPLFKRVPGPPLFRRTKKDRSDIQPG
jgi:ABC-type phosphate/phosphonate transport system substrate-binding protein